jgi:hypothetical protein
MARPHENPTLTTTCANPECRKVVSTEYPFSEGVVVEEAGRRRIVAVCRACVDQGWRPPSHRGSLGSS